jgi:hypothetical protein
MSAPGWPAFDPDVVSNLYARAPDTLDKSASGGMRCPLKGHNHRLPWNAGSYSEGTQSHGDPSLTFHVSPTYILEDPLENFIAGRDLVADMLNRQWKKAETFRLGHENSEDAVSWNVFRSLQEAGELKLAARVLAGIACDAEPELIVWGRRIDAHATTAAAALARRAGSSRTAPCRPTTPLWRRCAATCGTRACASARRSTCADPVGRSSHRRLVDRLAGRRLSRP